VFAQERPLSTCITDLMSSGDEGRPTTEFSVAEETEKKAGH